MPLAFLAGHSTVDLLDGRAERGGAVAYGAAAFLSLGWDCLILTSGELHPAVQSHPGCKVISLPCREPTTFAHGEKLRLISSCPPIPPELILEHSADADVAHLGPVAGEIDLPGVLSARSEIVGLDMQGILRRFEPDGVVRLEAPEWAWEAIESVDAVHLNGEEARALTGLSPREAARRISSKGCLSVVTDGPRGAYLGVGGEEVLWAPPLTAEVASDVGAGDVFLAAFLAGLGEGMTPVEAFCLGLSAASHSLEVVGPSILDGPSIRRTAELLSASLRTL